MVHTTVLLIVSAVYGPIIFTLYCAQLVIVIANKRKPQFRSSYFSLFIIGGITGLASFLITIITHKLPSFPEVNSFYAYFPSNAFTSALYFSIYYIPACEEYTNIFIALNRFSAITMYTRYEKIWSKFWWICLPVIFGFPFISYYHLVGVKAEFCPENNGTTWNILYYTKTPWRSNRSSAFYLFLATSITTLVLNLSSLIALKVVSKKNRSAVEIRLFLLGITTFVCGLPATYQQLLFMFTKSIEEMVAMLNRLPWFSDLKALAPSILSLIFSSAIRNELIRFLTRRKTAYKTEISTVAPTSRFASVMPTTLPLIIYAIYGPILFLIYLGQLIIVIVNKRRHEFRSSYFSLFIIEAFTGLSTFIVTTVAYKLPAFPQMNSFYANFPENAFASGLYLCSECTVPTPSATPTSTRTRFFYWGTAQASADCAEL